MENINFKDLSGYMNEKDLVESVADMPYALACAVIDQLDWVTAYSIENSTHNIDDNYVWDLFDVDGGYLELHSSIGGSFVTLYNTLDEVIEANTNWLEYDETNDEFTAIEDEEN